MKCKIQKSVYTFEKYKFEKKNLYQGVIAGMVNRSNGEPDELLTVGGESVSKFIAKFYGRKVWCIWAVNDTFLNPSEIMEDHIKKIIGATYTNIGAVYSELTGYLWTNDTGKIGGHDLIDNLSCYHGKYAFICIREMPIDLSHIIFED